MLEVSLVSLIAILVALWGSHNNVRYPLLVPCLILAAFLSTRYNYSCDYRAYARIFARINESDDWDHNARTRYLEIGWKILNRLCRPLGFQAVVIITTFFQLFSVGWFIQRFVPRKYQWYVFAIYVITPYMMLMGISAMRQTVSISIMLWGVPSILKRKIWRSLIYFFLALCFHDAAWITLPIIFAGYLNPKYWKTVALIEVAIIVMVVGAQAFLLSMINSVGGMLPTDRLNVYMNMDRGSSFGSGLGFMFRVIFYSYLIYNMKNMKDKPHLFAFSTIYIIGIVFIAIHLVATYLARLGWYYSIIGLPALVVYLDKFRTSLYARVMLITYVVFELYNLYVFYVETFPWAFLHFKSVL